MPWRDPNAFERELLQDTRGRWPEVIPLARCLVLGPRIEPLLLRNARREFVPEAQAEIESLLWFSPLVAARSTREIVLHLGVAKALAEDWLGGPGGPGGPVTLETLWQFTRRHTRHWSAEDRLERDLRYYALLGDEDRLRLGLRDILRRIRAETNADRQIALSRLVKRTLPVIAPKGNGPTESRLLARYAALALGDAGNWMQPGQPEALPPWLAAKLPEPIGQAELGVEVRYDARHGQALHLVAADAANERIAFPSPLPAGLYIAAEGRTGTWYTVTQGSVIPITPPSPSLRLTTLDGRQWDLRADRLKSVEPITTPRPLRLAYVPADRQQAQAIARWLSEHGVPIELVPESAQTASTVTAEARVVRLWTRAARDFWASRSSDPIQATTAGLLLRTEDIELPALGGGHGQVLDWRDWDRADGSSMAERLLENLRRWQEGGKIEAGIDIPPMPPEPQAPAYSEEVAALLDEINDPATEPPRRLKIGDRLAELGDPRPGVGVIEIEVPVENAEPSTASPHGQGEEDTGIESRSPPEIQRLLGEIDDPNTEPPRRLAIGDELERLGDPRPGVGLRRDGRPDIDWVEIGAGLSIYQDGHERELPAFWISRYPITNRQFQSFVDAGGYEPGRGRGMLKRAREALGLTSRAGEWWKGLKQPEPEPSRWSQGNRPRTGVDWYEAVAFTRWLSARWGLPEGAIRLPAEVEWEKAARGSEGLIYPWGNEYRSGFANIDETGRKDGPWYLKETTAVGLYPHGRSPYGVEDLAGTVWEWCLNKYERPDVVAADTSGDSRVLRGGSWDLHSVHARADYRYWYLPYYRSHLIAGFRVVSSVPIRVH
ncbi:MAG: SUMF1/EgtB/PvdO family nonheme iron enzyme [Gemmatimonadales bacterium]